MQYSMQYKWRNLKSHILNYLRVYVLVSQRITTLAQNQIVSFCGTIMHSFIYLPKHRKKQERESSK